MEKDKFSALKQYYAENWWKIYSTIDNPKFKVFRCRTTRGFQQAHVNLGRPANFKRFVKTKVHIAMYASVSDWSNAKKNYGKIPKRAEWTCQSNLLGTRLFIDVDKEGDLETARINTLEVINRLQNVPEIKDLQKVVFSGNKGFHVYYTLKHVEESDPKVREAKYEAVKKRIVDNYLYDLFDYNHRKILIDNHRVAALECSVKASTGYIVTSIPIGVFIKKTVSEMLTDGYIQNIYHSRVRGYSNHSTPMMQGELAQNYHKTSPGFINFTNGSPIQTTIPGKEPISTKVSPQFPICYTFIDNSVPKNQKYYIPVLFYNKKMFKSSTIKRVAKRYNLSDFFILETKNKVIAICLQKVHLNRYLKILRAAHAHNLKHFLFFKHSWIRLSPKVDATRRIISEAPKLRRIIHTEKGTGSQISHLHYKLFKTIYKFDYNITDKYLIGDPFGHIGKNLVVKVNG